MPPLLPSSCRNVEEVKQAAIHLHKVYLHHLVNQPLTARSLQLQTTAVAMLARRLEEIEAGKS